MGSEHNNRTQVSDTRRKIPSHWRNSLVKKIARWKSRPPGNLHLADWSKMMMETYPGDPSITYLWSAPGGLMCIRLLRWHLIKKLHLLTYRPPPSCIGSVRSVEFFFHGRNVLLNRNLIESLSSMCLFVPSPMGFRGREKIASRV